MIDTHGPLTMVASWPLPRFLIHHALSGAPRKHILIDKVDDCLQTLNSAGVIEADIFEVVAALGSLE
jgi:hypothetical protein